MTLVFLGLPHNGTIAAETLPGIAAASQRGLPVVLELSASSLLQRNFNELLAKCRMHQPRPTHFVIHHADIVPDVGWLDTLMAEMDRVDADVISVVSPIKDFRGLTTTGRFSADFTKLKRLTMHEIMQLPETFSADDVAGPLAINTGLFLCRTDRPWFDEMVFRMEDGITEIGGKLEAWCRSEDWLWSEWLAQKGARVFATRAVKIAHVGQFAYRNSFAYGSLQSEEERNWRL